MSPLATWAPKLETFCLEICCYNPERAQHGPVAWKPILLRRCRKGLRETSTYMAELEELAEAFATVGPGVRKRMKMLFEQRSEPKPEYDIGSFRRDGLVCADWQAQQDTVDVNEVLTQYPVMHGLHLGSQLVSAATGCF